MRILKFACILAVLIFSTTVVADVIGPHGETPHHHYSPLYFTNLALPVYLSVDEAPPGSALVFVKKGGRAAKVAWCGKSGSCSMTITTAGDLYLAPEGRAVPMGRVKNFGLPERLRLVREGKLDYLMPFKGKNRSYKSRMSCYLEKKGPSYTMECAP